MCEIDFVFLISDLTSFENLDRIISESFSAVSEEVKSAASYALGSICIGNLQQYLPFILTEDEDEPRRQYLLLHSLKEVPFRFILTFIIIPWWEVF